MRSTMQTKQIWTVLWAAAVVGVLAGACNLKSGSGDAPVPLDGKVAPVDLSVKVTDAPTTGALAGTVVDDNGAPIAGATVTADSATTTTDGSGAFSLAPPPGRAVLVASAKGKITLTRSVGVTSASPALRLKLVTAGASQMVTGAGGPLKAGVVTLTVPSGAYPSGGTVAATWIDRAHVSAASGRALFIDQDGTRHRFVGQLDVQASAQPASPVTVQIPIPVGTPSQATLVMFANDGAALGQRVLSTSMTNGFATFTIPHFSSWAVYLAVGAAEVALAVVVTSWMILDFTVGAVARQAAAATVAGWNLAPEEGLDIPSESEVGGVTVVAPNGAQTYLDDHVSRIHTDEDGTTSLTCIEVCNVQAEVPPTPPPPPGRVKFHINTPKSTGTMGVRGTVFSVRQKPCSGADGTAIDTVETSEGDVDFSVGGAHFDVRAGKQAEGCDGCKDPKQAVCDCDVKACEAAGGECLKCPGESPQARGALIEGSPFCVPKNSVCCARDRGQFVAVCSDSRGVCQCAGKSQAGCATRNSLCVTDRGGERILDCGLTPEQPSPCENALEGGGSVWSCDNAEAYLRDVNNCGSCGHKCPKNAGGVHSYVCNGGKCMDCNNGCGDGRVYCGNFKRCCALSPDDGINSTSCVTDPDDPAPGCSPNSSIVPRRPGTSSCLP